MSTVDTDFSKRFLSQLILRKTLLLFALLLSSTTPTTAAASPKLLLLITIDQLRGDIPWRFKDRFSDGGFNYLMNQGVCFKNAHYHHSNTLTSVGHATIVTGGSAAQHGIVGNFWYDTTNNKIVYSVEDESNTILNGEFTGSKGTSPKNLTSSTIGDELIIASGQKSRVYSISIKDRGAILPGGHLGKAFWYSQLSGKFVSSTYYYDAYPKWVEDWNKSNKTDSYKMENWDLLHTKDTYIFASQDDRPAEKSYKKLGTTFPHKLFNDSLENYYASLRFTPMADELTLEFAKTLIKNERIGHGPYTDMLAISFSASDYIGHVFGPNSLEAEDNILRLDLTLKKLFSFVNKKIGLENTLVVLTSDHGINAIPEYSMALNLPSGKLIPDDLLASMNSFLKHFFSIHENLIVTYLHPSIYLNLQTILRLGLEVSKVEEVLADELRRVPGVANAFTRTQLLQGTMMENRLYRKVQHAFHQRRSGNILLLQNQLWYLSEDSEVATVHGSPYAYDTHVPICVAGAEIKPKIVSRLVSPEDIAATLAVYLDIPIPSGSVGIPLSEALNY